jgi:hypothetical protein
MSHTVPSGNAEKENIVSEKVKERKRKGKVKFGTVQLRELTALTHAATI